MTKESKEIHADIQEFSSYQLIIHDVMCDHDINYSFYSYTAKTAHYYRKWHDKKNKIIYELWANITNNDCCELLTLGKPFGEIIMADVYYGDNSVRLIGEKRTLEMLDFYLKQIII